MAKAKRIKGINCNAAAAAGIKLVLVTRFKELADLQQAALNWTDPEGVHSMRVASRRLRSALRDFTPYLGKRGLTSSQKQLRTIADALGEVRDQDVAIVALEKLQTHVPAEVSPALKTYIEHRKEHREEVREELKSILQSDQIQQLESDFNNGLEKALTRTDPELTYRKMSQAIILDRLKELEKLSKDLFHPFEIEALHEMRIGAKRLRYAVELFQQCWRHSLGHYPKRIARIQSALGDLHDCDVWIESFSKEIGDARKHKKDDQTVAFVWLLAHFVKLRTKHLRQAYTRWCEWEAHDVGGKLRAAVHFEGPVAAPPADDADVDADAVTTKDTEAPGQS